MKSSTLTILVTVSAIASILFACGKRGGQMEDKSSTSPERKLSIEPQRGGSIAMAQPGDEHYIADVPSQKDWEAAQEARRRITEITGKDREVLLNGDWGLRSIPESAKKKVYRDNLGYGIVIWMTFDLGDGDPLDMIEKIAHEWQTAERSHGNPRLNSIANIWKRSASEPEPHRRSRDISRFQRLLEKMSKCPGKFVEEFGQPDKILQVTQNGTRFEPDQSLYLNPDNGIGVLWRYEEFEKNGDD